MVNAIKIQFPNDGNIYHIPLKAVAEIRAEMIAERDGIEIGSAEYFEELDIVYTDKRLALQIVNNLDWQHLKELMVYADSNDDISDKDEWIPEALKEAEFINSSIV